MLIKFRQENIFTNLALLFEHTLPILAIYALSVVFCVM